MHWLCYWWTRKVRSGEAKWVSEAPVAQVSELAGPTGETQLSLCPDSPNPGQSLRKQMAAEKKYKYNCLWKDIIFYLIKKKKTLNLLTYKPTRPNRTEWITQEQCCKKALTEELWCQPEGHPNPSSSWGAVFMSFGEGKAIWLALHRSIFPQNLHHTVCATSPQLFARLCHNWGCAVELKREPNTENSTEG